MKILFCGGGTAGHITPAIALAEKLEKSNNEIAFVGRENGKENSLIEKAKYKLYTIDIEGLGRFFSAKSIKAAAKTIKAIGKSKKILADFRPDIVFGMGGYVCFPVLTAAKLLKYPTALHESNSCPGLVTRLIGNKCDRLFSGFDLTDFKKFKKAIYTGNPVRSDFGLTSKIAARKNLNIPEKLFTVISIGGSGGAEKINDVCIDLIKEYSMKKNDICHIHITGEKYYDNIIEKFPDQRSTNRCRILPFVFNMSDYLSAADIIITRCGAITLSEISVCGIIPIMIPSPNVTDNHQYKNALEFSKRKAGILIEEKELSKELLINSINSIKNNSKIKNSMLNALNKFPHKKAKEKIIYELNKMMQK